MPAVALVCSQSSSVWLGSSLELEWVWKCAVEILGCRDVKVLKEQTKRSECGWAVKDQSGKEP